MTPSKSPEQRPVQPKPTFRPSQQDLNQPTFSLTSNPNIHNRVVQETSKTEYTVITKKKDPKNQIEVENYETYGTKIKNKNSKDLTEKYNSK